MEHALTGRSRFVACLLLLAAAGLPALAGGCGDGDGDAPVKVDVSRSSRLRIAAPAVAVSDRQGLREGGAAFAIDLYSRVRSGGGNVVFSPASVSVALSMTYAGARGTTDQEMARVLRFLPQAQQHAAMNEVEAALADRGAGAMGADGGPFRLRLVNTVWSQTGAHLETPFLDTLAEHYGAGVNLLDFATMPEPARQTINGWVSDQTEKKIEDLIPQGVITRDTRLVLTNAIYFNGAWKVPFAGRTGDAPWNKSDGTTSTVQMMRTEASLPAAVLPGLHAVALPYADERLSLLVVVPDAGKFAEVEAGFDGAALAGVVAALKVQTVSLGLPRFKFEAGVSLKQALMAMGMQTAFGAGADLSGIDGTRSLVIQDVIHKAFIAVAEKGTEAAAATAVVVGRTSAPQVELRLTVDRPFLFFLRDEPTGAILFMGRVLAP